jgi:hypothetical protein
VRSLGVRVKINPRGLMSPEVIAGDPPNDLHRGRMLFRADSETSGARLSVGRAHNLSIIHLYCCRDVKPATSK